MRILLTIFMLALFLININAQDLKKAYKYIKKSSRQEAYGELYKIKPANSASEYGLAFLSFKDYNYQYQNIKKDVPNKYIKGDGSLSIVSAYEHIVKADNLLPFKDEKTLNKIKDQYANVKVKELKKKVFAHILNLDKKQFELVYQKLNVKYSKFFENGNAFFAKMYERKADEQFIDIKSKIKKSNSYTNRQKLSYFIRDFKYWSGLPEAIDYSDSLKVGGFSKNSNYNRLTFLRENPESKHFSHVKQDYIKHYNKYKIRNFIIASSNDANNFVDSILMYKNKYVLYKRKVSQIDGSSIKEKYFLALYKSVKSSIIYNNLDELKNIQKQYPKSFICQDIGTSDSYMIFSKDKIYKNGKLLPAEYKSLIILNPSWMGESESWKNNLQDSILRKGLKIPILVVYDNFDKVGVKRNNTPYKTILNLSSWAKKYPDGGVAFVKSGKKAIFIRYPACTMMSKTMEKVIEYFIDD